MIPHSILTSCAVLLAESRWWRTVFGVALAVLGSVSSFLSAPAAEEMREHTLSNGLQVVLVEDHWHPLAALEVCYRAGSRYDPAGKQGLAHLLEHLTFRSLGLPHEEEAPPSEAGKRARATTKHDTTCYSHRLLRAQMESVLAAEAARMATLQMSVEDLEHEKAIVIQERRQFVEGDTWRNLLEEVDSIAFRLHPYRFPASGWPETLQHITLDDVQRHFTALYAPANAILVAVGDFHSAELLARIETHFGKIPARALPVQAPTVESAQAGERRLSFAPWAAPRMVYAYHVPAFGSLDTSALEVVSTLLSGAATARLPTLLYPHHLAENEGIEYLPLTQDPSLFYIKVALGPQVNFRLTGEAIDDVLWHLREDGLHPEELEQAKKRLLLDFYLNRSLGTRAERLAQYGVLAALPQAQRYTGELQAVTAADVQRVVRSYFSPDNRVIGITGVAHQEGVREHQGEAR